MQQATASHENSAAINAMPWPSMRTRYGRLLRNDLTITELWQKITAHGIKAGRSAVARFLLHLQLTFKKNSACRRAGTPGCQNSACRRAGTPGCQGRPRRLARDAEKP